MRSERRRSPPLNGHITSATDVVLSTVLPHATGKGPGRIRRRSADATRQLLDARTLRVVADLATHDWAEDPLFDSAIVRHGFAPYLRDYDVIAEVFAAKPDGTGSYSQAQYRYRFTHCVEAHVETTVDPETWKASWTHKFTTYEAWARAGAPAGFVWGVGSSDAYPGASLVADSPPATAWSQKLGRPMHELQIETNAFRLNLVCHDLRISQLAIGDPSSGELKPIGER